MPTEVAQPGLLELQGDNANLPSGGKSGHAGMFSFCLQNSSCPMFWVEYRSLGGGWALTEGGNSRKGLQKVQPERQSHEGCFVLKKGKPTVVKVWDEWGRSHRLQSQENFPPEILSAAAFEVHPPDPDQAPSSGCDVTLLSCIGNISPSFSLSMAGEGPGQGTQLTCSEILFHEKYPQQAAPLSPHARRVSNQAAQAAQGATPMFCLHIIIHDTYYPP